MGMGLTNGSMVLHLALLAPGLRLAIQRHAIAAETIEATPTVLRICLRTAISVTLGQFLEN